MEKANAEKNRVFNRAVEVAKEKKKVLEQNRMLQELAVERQNSSVANLRLNATAIGQDNSSRLSTIQEEITPRSFE